MDGRRAGQRGRRLLLLTALVTALVAGPAGAHEERASQFPPGNGTTPELRTLEEAADVVVVCKPQVSAERIAAIADPDLRAFNERLLDDCAHEHLQAAVDAVQVQGTNIYVLPGVYREQPSWDEHQPCTDDYDDGVVEYELVVSCGEVINLVTVAGDSPEDDDIVCDNQLCDLQIAGTGARPEDTAFRGGFKADGSWIKHNGIKADRADGFVLSNVAFQVFRENAIYVHETDGYLLDRVVASHNDLYGILTFTSDHGLIRGCDTAFNGDSGVYPGSASDVNADNGVTAPLERFAVEITGCRTHHNALGFSGSAGNSVWFHDNEVFHNAAGYVTDSFVPDHPGMPQDHAFLEDNRIYGNNVNYFAEYVQAGRCGGDPADRGYETGTVCPAFPVPVGTGVMIAGGNHNLVRDNDLFDNWRQGVMQFWVPAAVREEFHLDQFDTSNANHYTGNRMGFGPDGSLQPNGVDFWWDEQGVGNCWQDNTSASGEVTTNATLPLEDVTGGAVPLTGFPDCDSGGSPLPVGNVVKSAQLLSCATYDREDQPTPPACDWFDTPVAPAGRQAPGGEDLEASYWPTVSIDLSEGLAPGEVPGGDTAGGDAGDDGDDGGAAPDVVAGAAAGGDAPAGSVPAAATGVLPVTGAGLGLAAVALLTAGTLARRRSRVDGR